MKSHTPLLFHPLVVLAIAALCGSFAVSCLWPAVLVSCVWSVLGARMGQSAATGRSSVAILLLLCAALFTLTRQRALSRVAHYQSQHAALAQKMVEPARCAGLGTVATSPTIRSRLKSPAPSAAANPPPAHPGSAGDLAPKDPAPTSAEAENHFSTVERVSYFNLLFPQLDCGEELQFRDVTVRVAAPVRKTARGDRVEVIGQFAPVRLFRNAETGDAWPLAARRESQLSGRAYVVDPVVFGRGLTGSIDRLRFEVRERIEATYSPVVASLGRALVLGESDLERQDAEAFRNSGLLHLLAVSGTHLVIFVLSTVRALHSILVRITWLSRRGDVARWSASWGALSSLLYADFSGGSGSGWRAAIMLCCMCGCRALGLRVGGAAALGASLLIGVLWQPLAASDASFLLSALATAGLIGLGQPITRAACRGPLGRAPLRQLVESFTATVSSTVTCAPLLATMDDSMTWAALFANVVAAPLGELVALPACLLHAVVPFAPPLEAGLAFLGSGALFGVRQVALLSASVQSAQFLVPFPTAAQVAFLCVGIIGAAALLRRASCSEAGLRLGLCGILTLGGLELLIPTETGRARPLSITALDVGQGDSLLVELPDGRHALVDGGGYAMGLPETGTRVVLPVLRARGVERLDWMVLSHAHPDHISGLIPVARALAVGQLWIPSSLPEGERHLSPPSSCERPGDSTWGPLRELVEAVCDGGGTILSSAELCREPLAWGVVRVEVLSPCVEQDPRWSLNDASLVMRLSHGTTRALFTGDIERAAESWLLKQRSDRLRADWLKVAHHGSDTSSSVPFVQRVRPQTAFISAGVRNRHRHPRPRTLAALDQVGAAVFRTDERGSLTWSTDGTRHWVRTADQLVP